VLEADNSEHVLAQYENQYIMNSGKHMDFLTARLRAHEMEPPRAEREGFQKQMRSASAEPAANPTASEAVPEPNRSSRRDKDQRREKAG
jgi:hypothetical protein